MAAQSRPSATSWPGLKPAASIASTQKSSAASAEGRLGREAALVADVGVEAGFLQRALQRVEDFGAPAHRLAKRRRADRQDHEFLEVDCVVGVDAAVEDVHHGNGQDPRRRAADVAVKRQAGSLRAGLGDGQRDAENRVGAELRLVRRAVERDHRLVDLDLLLRLEAGDRVEDVAVDGFDRLQHALAAVSALVAVAQFDRFMGARRGPRGHAGSTHRSVLEHDVDFDGRIAAAVEDFARDDVNDGGHFNSSWFPCPGLPAEPSARATAIGRGGEPRRTRRSAAAPTRAPGPRALLRQCRYRRKSASGARVRSANRTFVVVEIQMINTYSGRKKLHGSPAHGGDIAQIFDYQFSPREKRKGGRRRFYRRRICRVCGRTGR